MEQFLQNMMDQPSLTISAAAAATSLHQQTIRSYEQRGLITPHRTPGGTRMYTYNDIMRLKMISSLSHAGVGIEGITKILEMEDEMDEMARKMDDLLQENIALRAALKRERNERRAVVARFEHAVFFGKGFLPMSPSLPAGDGDE